MKVILFGAGYRLGYFLKNDERAKKIEIMAITDNSQMKWGNIVSGYRIVSPNIVNEIEFDKIIITLDNKELCNEIRKQLNRDYGIEDQKVIRFEDLVMPEQINIGDMEFDCDYSQCYDINEIGVSQ